MSHEIINFPYFVEPKGTLTPFELDTEFPFEVKRVYTVTGAKNAVRGAHAHIIESEVFVCVAGSVTAVIDDGETCKKIDLDHPTKGLHVKTMCWHEFRDFSPDAVLLCFSSTHYLPGEQNYISDREEFYKRLRDLES